MFRALGAVLAFSLAAPTSALACGMYIPPTKHETQTTLASVLDSIDEAVKPADAKPQAIANENSEPEVTEAATADAPSEDNTRRVGKRHRNES